MILSILGLQIKFERPWYLLALILFFAFTIIPYFTLSKKYRKTRNRITSMCLHAIVSLLIVLMLAGTTFVRSMSNPSNEIILLVDVSNTEEQAASTRDEFIETVIDQSKFDNFKVGIVTFGYDQEVAVPLSKDYKNIYKQYKEATLPDTSATNIASALTYAKTLFSSEDSGKIVLVTDAKETDENAKAVIRQIVASGITIDTAYVESSYEGEDDFEIISATLPDYHVGVEEDCSINIEVYSSYATNATFKLYDNDEYASEINVDLIAGTQSITFTHQYKKDGLHDLTFVSLDSDKVEQNNTYSTYYYLEVFNKILIIEQEEGSSEILKTALTENNEYYVEVLNVYKDDLPLTGEALCSYDEVIMNNMANGDLPVEFVSALNDYVYNYGGGLFTTGGDDETGEAHAYNRKDMIGTAYQQMLPVQAINYTPPVGVIVIIDKSGSMSSTDDSGSTLLDWAKAGAVSCLNALTERDYFGLMTLDSDYGTILELTPRTQEAKILSAINSLEKADGSTVFPGAIDRAGQALRALKNVDKKHIIIVTDGQVPSSEIDFYESYAKNYYDTDGITISVVGVKMSVPSNASELEDENYPYDSVGTSTPYEKMLRLTKITHGQLHVITDNNAKLVTEMREDLNAPEIKEVNYEAFYPVINDVTSSLFKNVEILNDETHSNCMNVELDGFYGVKVRASATLLLSGDYNVPLYAQWKYGKGMVGSFMCDVSGDFSSSFMSDANGIQFLKNVINNLTPTENIRSNDIKLILNEDNYSNTLSIYTDLKEGETMQGTITYETSAGTETVSLNTLLEDMSNENLRNLPCYLVTPLSESNNYSRAKFVIKESGAYTINITKVDSEGKITGQNAIYKSFAYSEEYDTLVSSDGCSDLLNSIAKSGNGLTIEDLEDPHEIIDSFDTMIYKTWDPRVLFSILSICLFLIDIAIRKFKFKWPHELVKKWIDNRK